MGIRRNILLALALAGAALAPAWAQTTTPVTVTVDATAPGAAIEKIWPYHGYDEVNYTTSAAGRELLTTLGKVHSTPPYIRTHFLLNTGDGTPALKWGSTNVYTEDASGKPVYSWTLMDGIMDTITGAGALPLVEIAFMPQALTAAPATVPYRNSSTYAADGASFYPPKDYDKWGALVSAWAMHVAGRYPTVESSWQWELWNEPDIDYFHATNKVAEYVKLYDYTEAAMHAALPKAALGGPAVASAGSSFLTQFLQHCVGQGPVPTNAVSGGTSTRLDLITFHAKGGAAVTGGHVEMNLGNQLRLHQTGFKAVAAIAALKTKPIIVTEADPDGCAACTLASHPEDAYRNSPAYGAYEVAMMKRSLELEARLGVKLQGLVTWAFMFDPNDPSYFPGYRALAAQGIHLPVLNAFKLLGQLDGSRLPVTSSGAPTLDDILANSVRAQPDVDAMATVSGQRVQVLVWNYHDDIVAGAASSSVHLSVKVPASFGAAVTVTEVRADETHGDAYTTWVAQGSPAKPSAAQVTALKAAMEPVTIAPAHAVAVTGGAAAVDLELPRFGISLVTVTPQTGADGGTNTHTDAAMVPSDAGADASAAPDAPVVADAGADDTALPPPVDVGSGRSDASVPPHGGSQSGCSCSSASEPAAGWGAALGLVLLGAVARRRRSARPRGARSR